MASENRTDIALDDPNFWQKWAKKADLDLDLLNSKVGEDNGVENEEGGGGGMDF